MPRKVVNDKTTGKFVRKFICDSCQLIKINGVVCHETGCPEAWKDESRECVECGMDFQPEERYQQTCDPHCYATFMGMPCGCGCSICEAIREDEENSY